MLKEIIQDWLEKLGYETTTDRSLVGELLEDIKKLEGLLNNETKEADLNKLIIKITNTLPAAICEKQDNYALDYTDPSLEKIINRCLEKQSVEKGILSLLKEGSLDNYYYKFCPVAAITKLKGNRAFPEKLKINSESLEKFKKGIPGRGFIYFVNLDATPSEIETKGNIYLYPAVNVKTNVSSPKPNDAKSNIEKIFKPTDGTYDKPDKSEFKEGEYLVSSAPKTSQTGGLPGASNLHNQGARILGLGGEALLAGGFWKGDNISEDKNQFGEFRTRSSQNMNTLVHNKMFMLYFRDAQEIEATSNLIGHSTIYKREIPTAYLTKVMNAMYAELYPNFKKDLRESKPNEFTELYFNSNTEFCKLPKTTLEHLEIENHWETESIGWFKLLFKEQLNLYRKAIAAGKSSIPSEFNDIFEALNQKEFLEENEIFHSFAVKLFKENSRRHHAVIPKIADKLLKPEEALQFTKEMFSDEILDPDLLLLASLAHLGRTDELMKKMEETKSQISDEYYFEVIIRSLENKNHETALILLNTRPLNKIYLKHILCHSIKENSREVFQKVLDSLEGATISSEDKLEDFNLPEDRSFTIPELVTYYSKHELAKILYERGSINKDNILGAVYNSLGWVLAC